MSKAYWIAALAAMRRSVWVSLLFCGLLGAARAPNAVAQQSTTPWWNKNLFYSKERQDKTLAVIRDTAKHVTPKDLQDCLAKFEPVFQRPFGSFSYDVTMKGPLRPNYTLTCLVVDSWSGGTSVIYSAPTVAVQNGGSSKGLAWDWWYICRFRIDKGRAALDLSGHHERKGDGGHAAMCDPGTYPPEAKAEIAAALGITFTPSAGPRMLPEPATKPAALPPAAAARPPVTAPTAAGSTPDASPKKGAAAVSATAKCKGNRRDYEDFNHCTREGQPPGYCSRICQ
jgi:hypothetical protein